MDKAKAAVSSFIGKSGHHDTTVDEQVAPSVTQEEIKPTRHDEVTEAVDREIHQDHYHTTVQPLQHQEIRPEQHTHNMAGVQEKRFEHDDATQTKRHLESQAAQFKDQSTTHETTHSTGVAPRVEGEHVHHHVHEIVQPVVHKETVQPEVLHTTVPIHEKHHAEAEHHGTSVLPMKTLDEFTSGGGIVAGGGHKQHGAYEGDPRPYNASMQAHRTDADINFKAHDGLHDHQRALGHSGEHATTGHHSHHHENKLESTVDSDRDGRSGLGTTGTGSRSALGGATAGAAGAGGLGSTTRAGPHDTHIANEMDSRVDSDRDGRSGIASTGTGTGFSGQSSMGTGPGSTTTAGPHDSNMANRVDPRVDSDRGNHHHGEAAAGLGAAGVVGGGYEAAKHHDRDTAQSRSGLGNQADFRPGQSDTSTGHSGLGTNDKGGSFTNDPMSAPGHDSSTTGIGGSGVGSSRAGMGSNEAGSGAFANDPTTAGEPRHDDAVGSSAHQATRSAPIDSTTTEPSSTRSTAMSDSQEPTSSSQQQQGSSDQIPDDGQQHASQGTDPNVVEDKSKKLTGTGAPGSHSALFGLTPDGKKGDDVDYKASAKPQPAHSDEDTTAASGDGAQFTGKRRDDVTSTGDTGSRAPEGAGVQEQLDDPRVTEKGHDQNVGTDETTGGKPGAGSSSGGFMSKLGFGSSSSNTDA